MREGVCSVIDYSTVLNQKVQAIKPSGIRRFFDIANEMDNVISLSIGEPDSQRRGMSAKRESALWRTGKRGILQTVALSNCARKFRAG